MIRTLYMLMTGIMLVMLHGCGEEDYPVPPASTVPKFTVAIDNNEFAPALASFTNTSVIPERAGTFVYYWNFGDGTTSTEKDPAHTYKRPGVFDVKLVVVTGSSNEINEFTQQVIIKDPNASGTPVYFTDGGTLFTALINDQAPLATPTGIKSLGDSYCVAIDTAHDKLYVTDYDGDRIVVANLDGTEAKDFRTGIGTPTSVAIDYTNNMLYWDTDTGIRRTSLDNSDVSAFDEFATGQSDPEGVSVDPVTKRLYWNTYSGSVWRQDLNGTTATVATAGEGGGSMLVVGDRIFFDTRNVAQGISQLVSTKMDGTGRTVITSGMGNRIYGIAYDGETNKLYWADRGSDRIMRANLDGTEPEPWYTGMAAKGLAIGKNK
ncbi:PKD domain-containing protein [Fulvivirgaceae bacterium PWU5]|uniref:PKD domain-containing protein n=1 Tax=Dawidia cretensis TaxID=2782350 RepID=A0AAP2DUB7_9BACT|nr:PKD domain-containing protein [Dawidia cretensis]MBT1707590.1 PKD domain-containing protein [Dawidia cretensis]